MVKRILSGDIQIVDIIVPLPNEAQLAEQDRNSQEKYAQLNTLIDSVLKEQRVQRGQKARLSFEQFQEFTKITAGLFTKRLPGGSSANTLATLSKLLGDEVQVDMLGVAGKKDENSILIRDALTRANVNLIPPEYHLKPHQEAEPATSFVFQAPDGSRTILTYPGNAREILKADAVTNELMAKNDVLFVQGSLWEKFEESFPNKLMELRWKQDAKEIWLALPTHAKFRDNMPPEKYRKLIPSADMVLGNSEELMRIYETTDIKNAVTRLQQALSKRDDVLEWEHKSAHDQPAVAFITCGKDGAILVTADSKRKGAIVTPGKIIEIAPPNVSGIPKLFELGAGDSSYAGFLAGHIAGLSPEESAHLGMQLAGTKLQFDNARIPDPRDALPKFSVLGRELLKKVDAHLAIHGGPNQPARVAGGK